MSLYSGLLFLLNIVCIVLTANLTFMVKKVNVVAPVAITKSKERARSTTSLGMDPSYEDSNDEVSTYVSPTFKHRRDDAVRRYMDNTTSCSSGSSSIVNTLLCGVQHNDNDIEEPLVHSRELMHRTSQRISRIRNLEETKDVDDAH